MSMNMYAVQVDTEFTFGQWIVVAPNGDDAKKVILEQETWLNASELPLTCMYLAEKPFLLRGVVMGGHKSDG